MARRYILYKGLRERIAERQAPPPVMPDRAKWQEDYVARSRSGTDIRSTSGEVGDTGVKQEQMNAMTPAERQARLRQIAASPTVPHYHALPSGQIAWGHGGEGTRPLKPGDKLMAYRGIEKKPTELRVHSVNETHLGQGMRVIHPDKIHEDMHGPPLHPMHLASATHIAPPHPLPLAKRPMLMKSRAGKRKNTTKHKVVAKHIRHTPALGREGRDRHGSDVWYHAGFLLAHDPDVARGCGLGQGDSGDGGDAAPSLAQSLPDGLIVLAKSWLNRRHISKPGSRGGRFYYDQHGEVAYGERPSLRHREAQIGDHALTANGHGRISDLGDGQMTVRHAGGPQTYGAADVREIAPGHHQGDELSPRMQDASSEPPMQGAGALRRRMIASPQPGDRAVIGDGQPATVHRVDDQEIGLKDDTGSLYRMSRTHWQRDLEEHARPLPPAPGSRPADPGDSVSPRDLTADAMRQAMTQEPPASPTDTSADDPHRARLRAALANAPWVGDTIAVVKPLALDGNAYEAGKRYAVAYVEDGMAELLDGDGDPVATLSSDNWRDLLGQNAVVPLERGEMPDDDVTVPGEGVHGVFGGQVSKQEFKAAWEGTFAGGFATKTDTLHEETGKAMLAGSIVAPNGETVGTFERHALRDGRGNVTIEHVLMDVNQDMKIGFADQFNAQAEESYQRWGVRQINVYANISVGKYCWAQQGYTFADPDEREAMIDRFDTWCKAHGHTVPDNRLVQMQHPWDIAGYTDGPEVHVQGHPRTKGGTDYVVNGTFPIGKAFFLADPKLSPLGSGSWHGVKVLGDPDHPTMRQARRYRKGKK